MDILSQYRQQHPEAFREKPQWQPSAEYGFFIRLVMRLSGGRIREMKQAAYLLLGVAVVAVIITIIVLFIVVFFGGAGVPRPPAET